MDPFRFAAGNAATGEPDRHAAAHGGADVAADTRPKPDRYANSITDANTDAHARALAESDG